MPTQVTVSDVAEKPAPGAARRLLIDGRRIAGEKAFPSIHPTHSGGHRLDEGRQ
ncbi:hypothetical protein BN973_05185 [Mycobacterium triplex]|uniref:Uncharacterized protein n=1 Tax=Mycobacterium triplex TaxID=47839 RepID=A0A024K409_9MYCO|nr:hypothetical protein BN973_05185 [Mycobacterium triplex]